MADRPVEDKSHLMRALRNISRESMQITRLRQRLRERPRISGMRVPSTRIRRDGIKFLLSRILDNFQSSSANAQLAGSLSPSSPSFLITLSHESGISRLKRGEREAGRSVQQRCTIAGETVTREDTNLAGSLIVLAARSTIAAV